MRFCSRDWADQLRATGLTGASPGFPRKSRSHAALRSPPRRFLVHRARTNPAARYRGIGFASRLSHSALGPGLIYRGSGSVGPLSSVATLMDKLAKSRDSALVRTLDRKTSAASASLSRTFASSS
jgi:hypothetical protein